MKHLIPLLFPLALSSCAQLPSTPDAGAFLEVSPEPAPDALVGTWTGAMDPYISTLEIKGSGRGVLCSSYASWESTAPIKHTAGKIRSVGFGPASYELEGDLIRIDPEDEIYPTYTFRKDSELQEATNYCRKHFRKE